MGSILDRGPGRPSRATLVVVTLVGLAVGVGITFLVGQPPSPEPEPAPADTLVLRNVSGLNGMLTYGIDSGAVDLPADSTVRTEGYEAAAAALAQKDATAGLVSITQVPGILDANPDARVLPFSLFAPGDMAGIYVPRDSDIQEVSGLQGRTLALIDRPLVRVMADVALEEMGGLAAGAVDRSYYASNATAPAADAYYLVGYPGDGFRSLAFPLEYLSGRFGSSAPLNVFVVSDGADTAAAVELVRTLNASARYGTTNVDGYLDGAAIGTTAEQLVRGVAERTGDAPVRRMDAGGMRYGQDILDRAAAAGLTGSVNLSAATVDVPS